MTEQHAEEIASGDRFQFGENWLRFLDSVDERRIARAEQSLRDMLQVQDLEGKTYLDVGSGSGLFSLAARRMGATVHSFDYDPASVAATTELRRRYYPAGDARWSVERGSVLDDAYLRSLGRWDVVYSWGVLHHTGNMAQALANVSALVAEGGALFIAIYNDQGRASKMWLATKKAYNRLPEPARWAVLGPAMARLWGPTMVRDLLKGKPLATWRAYPDLMTARGMSPWRDVVDWVGGLPFEVATPEEIFHFYRDRGFTLKELKTCQGGLGCNEYVFEKTEAEP